MKKLLKQMKTLLREKYGNEKADNIIKKAISLDKSLCDMHMDDLKEVKVHTFKKIYPTIALYRAMQDIGIDKDEAVGFLDFAHCKLSESKANSMRAMLKLPGLYKKMPAIFESVTKKQFGLKQGFRYKFYDMGRTRCKFDMTNCLYCDVCKANNCFELVKCFCHTDDVCDANMHPKIKWNRTKTMGEGGDVCDFDLYINE